LVNKNVCLLKAGREVVCMEWTDLLFEQSSSEEDIEDEEEQIQDDGDGRHAAESDISEVSVPEEVLEVHTNGGFSSDGTTVSDVSEVDNGEFSQWTDSLDAVVAALDPAAPRITVPTGADVNETSRSFESPQSTPHSSRAGTSTGNSMLASPTKRRLDPAFDTLQGPPVSRQRQIVEDAVSGVQNELSPLRKTLSSALSLRTP